MVAHLDIRKAEKSASSSSRRRPGAPPRAAVPTAPIEREAGEDERWVRTRALYLAVARGAGDAEAEALRHDAWLTAARVRRVFAGGDGLLAAAPAADRWLRRRFGRCGDDLRRAMVASLALVLAPEGLPDAVADLYPEAHLRLARFLAGGAPYDPDFFAKDLAFGAGVFLPIGALSLGRPTSRALPARAAAAKRAAGLLWRTGRAHGAGAAMEMARRAGARPWVELHVDTRNLRTFNPAGFEAAYRRVAAFLRLHPGIAGLHGASWLYDPALTEISPGLAFVSEPIQWGGAMRVRLGVDPVQTAYAVSRSAARRQLWLEGRYNPVCYGLYWPRAALLAWDEGRSRPV